jgi:hypothetical protein
VVPLIDTSKRERLTVPKMKYLVTAIV